MWGTVQGWDQGQDGQGEVGEGQQPPPNATRGTKGRSRSLEPLNPGVSKSLDNARTENL